MLSLAYMLVKEAPACHLLKGKYIKKDCKKKSLDDKDVVR